MSRPWSSKLWQAVGGVFPLIVAIEVGLSTLLAQSLPCTLEAAPIEKLWWIVAEGVTPQNVGVVGNAVVQWRDVGTFDAFSVGLLPPTFVDLDTSITLVNGLNEQIPGRLIVGAFPTGTEGWETSFNQRFAERLAPLGVNYDSTRALSREAWLGKLEALQASLWAYVLEQPARRPTADEVETSIWAFVQRAREQNKGVVLWLSAMMLRQAGDRDIVRRIWTAVGNQVDAVVWMDLPIVSQDPGRTLEGLLDTLISLTSLQKVMIQWTHNPNLITKDTTGTLEYIARCQARGINRFVLLANPYLLQQEPWNTFYHNLPKITSLGKNEQGGQGFVLYPSYTTPFHPSITVRFFLPTPSQVELKIFDILGREVMRPIAAEMPSGEHTLTLNTSDLCGGIYFCRLCVNNLAYQRKFEVIK